MGASSSSAAASTPPDATRASLASAAAQVQRAHNEVERLRKSEARYREVAAQALTQLHQAG